MQINLDLRTPSIVMLVLTLVLDCEYLKYSRLCPWLFKWPEYEAEQQYEEDDQQDVYHN